MSYSLSFVASVRVTVATMLICVVGYSAVIWGVGQITTPYTALGSLITAPDGKVIGSRLIAQKFEQPQYFWPRPSSAGKEGYDATSAAGSNKSPTSSDLTDRATKLIERYRATVEKPLPPELAAASGGGLDPHISEHAALYQAGRVAQARGLPKAQIESIVREHAFAPGGFLAPDRLVNVLELNVALDTLAAPVAVPAPTAEPAPAPSPTGSPASGAERNVPSSVPTTAPSEPRVETAPAPAPVPGVTPSRPAAESAEAEKLRRKQCAAQWKAQKTELRKANPTLNWSEYWRECDKRLKASQQ